MWHVCLVLHAVLYVCVCSFAGCGCAVSRRYIYIYMFASVMFSVANV